MDVIFDQSCMAKSSKEIEFVTQRPVAEKANQNFFAIQRDSNSTQTTRNDDGWKYTRRLNGSYLVRPVMGTWLGDIFFAWVIKGRVAGRIDAFATQFDFIRGTENNCHFPKVRRLIDEETFRTVFKEEDVEETLRRINIFVHGGHDVVAD